MGRNPRGRIKNLRFMKRAECFSNAFCAKVVAFVIICIFFIFSFHHFFKQRLASSQYKRSCDLFITFKKNQKNIHEIIKLIDICKIKLKKGLQLSKRTMGFLP